MVGHTEIHRGLHRVVDPVNPASRVVSPVSPGEGPGDSRGPWDRVGA
jgi:hypothetical protein